MNSGAYLVIVAACLMFASIASETILSKGEAAFNATESKLKGGCMWEVVEHGSERNSVDGAGSGCVAVLTGVE